MKRYVITIRSCPAPSSGGGRFRRPVTVRVLDTNSGRSEWHWVRNGVVQSWPNVDSRYSGPRAAYGQALESARALAAELNDAIVLPADSRPLEIAA